MTRHHNGKVASNEDIRLCAYQKWEAAGKPTGDGVQFWLEAEQELAEEKNQKFVQRSDRQDHGERERLETQRAIKEGKASVDRHYRDNNRMFQGHGERGHRADGSG